MIKAWFRAQIAPYLAIVKAQASSGNAALVEYVDSDKTNAAVGSQWLRVNSVRRGQVMFMVGGTMVTSTRPTVQLRTQTNGGVL